MSENTDIVLFNFGPISQSQINLKKLTIFIGPNNSGKSYVAMITHILLNVMHSISRSLSGSIRDYMFYDFYEPSEIRKLYPEIFFEFSKKILDKKTINKLSNFFIEIANQKDDGLEIQIPEELVNLIFQEIKNLIKYRLPKLLSDEIKRNFSRPLNDLTKYGSDCFKISLNSKKNNIILECEDNKLILSKFQISTPPIFVLKKTLKRNIRFQFKSESFREDKFIKGKVSIPKKHIKEYFKFDILGELLYILIKQYKIIFEDLIKNPSYYLPATRSGLLQAQKALSASFIHLSSLAGIKPIQIPTLSGIITDFIISITTMEKKKKRYFELTPFLENEILKGEIDITMENIPFPEISYFMSEFSKFLELYKTSSMVSELAPIVLYFKYIINEKGFIIIEEPESHLHPDAQRKFARFVVKLIRAGLNVLLTTHSDYLLLQLNNFVRLSITDENRREELGYDKDDFINQEEINAYYFKFDKESKGVKTVNLEINEYGINEDHFANLINDLYGESIKLDED